MLFKNDSFTETMNAELMLFDSTELVHVEFTDFAFHQFGSIRKTRGYSALNKSTVLEEMALYITAHEAAGIGFNEDCQTIRFDDRLNILMFKANGIWYIADIFIYVAPATNGVTASKNPTDSVEDRFSSCETPDGRLPKDVKAVIV